MNRIGEYFGPASECLDRATTNIEFCRAMAHLSIVSGTLSDCEIETLGLLHTEAVQIFRLLDVPPPWETGES